LSHCDPRLANLRHFLLDMDGTLYLGGRLLPGAEALLAYLRASGRSVLFLTNNPTRHGAEYSEKLRRLGIPAAAEEVLTAGAATVRYLRMHTPYRRVFALGTPSFEAELREAGIDPGAEAPEAVVLAFDTTLTYAKLERAALLLAQGLPYIATNPDRVCPTERGFIPDCGATAALLEAATGRRPKFIGKPDPELARLAMEKLGASPASTAMVGDRLYTDLEMARLAGMTGILLLSGETQRAALEASGQRVDFVFEDAAALLEALRAADAGHA
jgi:HAD superfamily hydrolase (TIGR01450 family)